MHKQSFNNSWSDECVRRRLVQPQHCGPVTDVTDPKTDRPRADRRRRIGIVAGRLGSDPCGSPFERRGYPTGYACSNPLQTTDLNAPHAKGVRVFESVARCQCAVPLVLELNSSHTANLVTTDWRRLAVCRGSEALCLVLVIRGPSRLSHFPADALLRVCPPWRDCPRGRHTHGPAARWRRS